MKRIFTLKLYVFLCLLLFVAQAAQSQCAVAPVNCPAVTETFETNTFKNLVGVAYNAINKNYEATTGNISTFNLVSYRFTITSNSVSVTLQPSDPNSRLSNAVTIQALDATTSAVLCTFSTATIAKPCATFTTLLGKTVQFKFIFTRASNGGAITFDNFGIDPEQIILPVTFGSFEGKKTETGTQLTWKVAGESNVKQYDVERSTAGTNGFVKIGSVPATGSESYTFTDATVFNSTVIYRIKNVDNDGRFKYSTLLYFKNGTGSVAFRVVPTVVTSKTTVEHNAAESNAVITLTTADGKVLRNVRPATGSVQTSVDMNGLPRGLYLLKWSNGTGSVAVVKVVKQ